jgi:hypothetical protein
MGFISPVHSQPTLTAHNNLLLFVLKGTGMFRWHIVDSISGNLGGEHGFVADCDTTASAVNVLMRYCAQKLTDDQLATNQTHDGLAPGTYEAMILRMREDQKSGLIADWTTFIAEPNRVAANVQARVTEARRAEVNDSTRAAQDQATAAAKTAAAEKLKQSAAAAAAAAAAERNTAAAAAAKRRRDLEKQRNEARKGAVAAAREADLKRDAERKDAFKSMRDAERRKTTTARAVRATREAEDNALVETAIAEVAATVLQGQPSAFNPEHQRGHAGPPAEKRQCAGSSRARGSGLIHETVVVAECPPPTHTPSS